MNRSHARGRLVVLALLVGIVACADTTPLTVPDDAGLQQAAPADMELRDRFQQASPEVMALPGTVFAARDEATGQLVFGVERPGVARDIQPIMARRGVPATAYRIQVTEPIHFMNTLRDEHRPVVGGVQIHWSGYVCTLGFSVDHAGGRSFITNSHCTENQGSTGNTQYNQPLRSVSPDPIGFEADDPEYFRGGECSRGKVCRYSDAARALYEPGVESHAQIAKTDGVNNGSLVVDGYFDISSQDAASTEFSGTLHKVGRTTGWSSGDMSNTCVTVNVAGSNIQLLCQTMVQNQGTQIVAGGDSGSPVFEWSGGSNVKLVGILWGGTSSGETFVFSPFSAIQDELRSMDATTDGTGGDGGNGNGNDDDDEEDDEDDNGDNGSNCPGNSQRPGCR